MDRKNDNYGVYGAWIIVKNNVALMKNGVKRVNPNLILLGNFKQIYLFLIEIEIDSPDEVFAIKIDSSYFTKISDITIKKQNKDK